MDDIRRQLVGGPSGLVIETRTARATSPPVTSKLNVVDHAKSFELMAVLVAAGYGIGFAGKSRIDTTRKFGIVAAVS